MVEAISSLQHTPTPNHAQRQSMSRAIRVLAQQAKGALAQCRSAGRMGGELAGYAPLTAATGR